MRRLAVRLARLYPAAWRARYGAELEALLADMDLRPRDLADLARGALAAHAHQLKENSPMKPIPWTAVVSVLLAPVLLAAVLLLSGVLSEGAQEFLLLVAPALILPAVGPLSAYYPAGSPRAAQITRWVGWASGALVAVMALVAAVVSAVSPDGTGTLPALGALFIAGLGGLAVWFVLNGWLGLRGGVMPAALGLLGILFGALSAVVFTTSIGGVQAALPRPAFTSAMSLVTPLWLLSFFGWMAWTGVWLWGQVTDLRGLQDL